MKIRVYVDSGANIHSERSEIIDLEQDWGITDDVWKERSEKERYEAVEDWAYNSLQIGYEEVGDE